MKDIEGLVIAKMDAIANEVPDLNILGYPTLSLYGKYPHPIEFTSARTIENLNAFMSRHSALY